MGPQTTSGPAGSEVCKAVDQKVKVGDLVTLIPHSSFENIPISESHAESVRTQKPLIFVSWYDHPMDSFHSCNKEWARLLHHDGTIKVMHTTYLIPIKKSLDFQ